jgi:hypothetical protein
MAVFERRYLKNKYHLVPQWLTMGGFPSGSTGTLLWTDANLTEEATPLGTDRYRHEKSGMTDHAPY